MSFADDEIELLASLPYKVGMWISYADDVDGENDDRYETKALETCLRQFAKLHEDVPLVSRVMQETLRRREKYVEWADQSFNVLLDIKKGIDLARPKATADELKGLKRALMEIGTAVAQAGSELGAFDEGGEEGVFSRIIGKLSGLAASDSGHPMNVSATEGSALEKLRETLRGKT